MLDITVSSELELGAVAAELALCLPASAFVLLTGDLGAGKTAFARAAIRAMVGDNALDVPSPTFNLVSFYDTSRGPVYHYDLYRVKQADELDELGMEDAASARAAFIEWPDRMGGRVPRHVPIVRVTITSRGSTERRIVIDSSDCGIMPDTAFIFAAGLGTRMRDRVRDTPKPLVPVAGRPTLAYIFDDLAQAGVKRLFINTHYLPEKIDTFVDQYRGTFDVTTLYEPTLLETGGGMLAALPRLDRDVMIAINGDALIMNGRIPFLNRLAMAFDPAKMDILLLLFPVDQPSITPNVGDYFIDPHGRLTRSLDLTGTHMFAGARVFHTRVFDDAHSGIFSFRDQMDAAQAQGRLYGLVHTGIWHHISTPEDVDAVSAAIKDDSPSVSLMHKIQVG
jgi:MurNAc alpha-1-phosphate uridylyltransferase